MKSILFFLLTISTFIANGQLKTQINFLQPPNKVNNDTIYFAASQPLVWNDFKGAEQQKGMAIAETSSGFGFNAGFKMINNKGTLTVNIFCYFDKLQSWVKADKKSNYALQHEQNHFTISYIATNYFYQQLKKAKFTRYNYNDLLNEIYNASMEKLQQMQNQYDAETRNGIIVSKQKVWDTKIKNQLIAAAKG
ncbi:MAG: hypothetical protein KA319_11645 [Ferruginibacter sp.]|nr:hypothetical protein [Ferruginibacter sp.]